MTDNEKLNKVKELLKDVSGEQNDYQKGWKDCAGTLLAQIEFMEGEGIEITDLEVCGICKVGIVLNGKCGACTKDFCQPLPKNW